MHILVCDDDAAFAARMDEYISEWFRAREIQVQSTVCTSGEQLLATPELERYQLAFLDVDLKTTDGIALGRKLRQVAPDIVLVYISAYLEFAPQGYTVNAYRYLLKRDIAAQLLKGMMRELCDRGGAIFFSTHVLEVAEKLCDKVAIIKGGKLIRSGTMEEVKGDDSLEEVFLELEGESC